MEFSPLTTEIVNPNGLRFGITVVGGENSIQRRIVWRLGSWRRKLPPADYGLFSGMENAPNQYFVAENKLIQLDMAGKKIEGKLAEKYVLAKQ